MKFEPNELVRVRKVEHGEKRPRRSDTMFGYVGKLIRVMPYSARSDDDYTSHGYIWKESDFETFPFIVGAKVAVKKEAIENFPIDFAEQNFVPEAEEKYEIFGIDEERAKVVLKYKGRLVIVDPEVLDASSICAPPINPNRAFKKAKAKELEAKEAEEAKKYGWGQEEVAAEPPKKKRLSRASGPIIKKSERKFVMEEESYSPPESVVRYWGDGKLQVNLDELRLKMDENVKIVVDKATAFKQMYGGPIGMVVDKSSESESEEWYDVSKFFDEGETT